MINVKINDVLVEIASQVTYNRNRKEKADFGRVSIVNTRQARYEPYTRLEFESNGITEQYLIESDEPLQLKANLWEHEITLIENTAILTTLFPVDRQFTRRPSLTIAEILTIYQRELEFYHDFEFDFVSDSLLNTKVVNKEYTGQDFAAIVYDLFRRIDAIPRLTWDNGWVLSYELYTAKRNAITPQFENRQSSVNDIDYATEVLTKTRNAVSESDTGIWFPSKNGYVTPRSVGTQLTTSELQYELDSNIGAIYEAYALDIRVAVYNKDFNTTKYLDIDITNFILEDEIYKTLEDDYGYDFEDYKKLNYSSPTHKQHCVTYKLGNNLIETLFTKDKSWLFEKNVNHLGNAILSAFNDEVKQNLKDEIIAENPDFNFQEDVWEFIFVNFSSELTFKTEDVKLRIRYRPQRDIDYISEKLNSQGFNKATIKNEQRDKAVEISRMLENSSAIVNRIGNEVINVTMSYDSLSDAPRLGDYMMSEWLITDIQYQLDKLNVVVTADFTKGFSNIERETSITREPSAYVYTGNNIVSNYILREYLLLSKTAQPHSTNLTLDQRRTIMNIFDYQEAYNKPLTNVEFKPRPSNQTVANDEAIHMPVMTSAGGNTMIMHVGFRDARIAGNGLRKIGTAWYKKPVYYTDESDFTLKDAEVKFTNDITLKTDTDNEKFYPLINESADGNSYILPIDKDPNDIFALTYQIIVINNDDDIVIPNGFAKFNNLIRSYDKAPDITIYSNDEKYTIFDKFAKGTEISGNVVLTDTYIEVLDALDDPIMNWALVIDGEIILAGNDNISRINYAFRDSREEISLEFTIIGEIGFDLDELVYSVTKAIVANGELNFELNDLSFEHIIPYLFDSEAKLEFSLNDLIYDVQSYLLFDSEATLNFTLDDLTWDTITFELFDGSAKLDFVLDDLIYQVDTFELVVGEGGLTFNLNDLVTEVDTFELIGGNGELSFQLNDLVYDYFSPITKFGEGQLTFTLNDLIFEHIIYKNVTYNLNGGINVGNPTQITNQDNYPISLNDAIKSGYTFDGWYESSDFSTPRLYALNSFKTYTLYAKWI